MARPEEVKLSIKYRLDREEGLRENAYTASREIIRSCREIISELVTTGRGGKEDDILGTVGSLDPSSIGVWGFTEDAMVEVAEAFLLSRMLSGADLPTPEETGIPHRAFLLGSLDAVGELRRCVLNSMMKGDKDRAIELFHRMETLAYLSEGLVYPSGMINLKKKQDTARALLDRTQGDLAIAISTGRLFEGGEHLEG